MIKSLQSTRYLRSSVVLWLLALVSACASVPPLSTVPLVDLDRFAGDWYVIASIPTPLEKQAFNAVEHYEPPVDGVIETTFTFNHGALDGPVKTYRPKGFVKNTQTNAVWGMQFVWPIKADYKILYLDKAYTVTMIGRSKRDYLWIMAREKKVPEEQYQGMLQLAESVGYDLTNLRIVPHGAD